MNKNARKLIPAVAMLLVSATMLSTASFAWFSMNNEVSATGMQVNVNAPASLLISNTGADSGFQNTINVNETAAKTLGHASSTNGMTLFAAATDEVEQDGTITPDSTLIEVDNGETYEGAYMDGTVGYVDYVFWLATSGSEDVEVAIDETTTKFTTTSGNSALLPAFRFAVLMGTGADTNPGEVSVPQVDSEDANNVWAGVDNTEQAPNAYTSTTYNDIAAVAQYGYSEGDSFVANQVILQLPGTSDNNISGTKIVIRIWLEGQDEACVNANSVELGQYGLTVGFKLVETGVVVNKI